MDECLSKLVYSYHGILLNNTKVRSFHIHSLNESQGMLSEKIQSQKVIYGMIQCI